MWRLLPTLLCAGCNLQFGGVADLDIKMRFTE